MTNLPKATRRALTREETGQSIGVSAVSVDRLVKKGLLTQIRVLGRPLFPVTEIERFLSSAMEKETHTHPPESENLAGKGVE